MTTLFDMVIALFKGNQRKYRLFIGCNVLAIGILFSLRLLLDNPSMNDTSFVDPMISSNVFAPAMLMHLFEIFFIPYTLVLFNKQIGKNYGILLSLGLSEKQFVSCVLIENVILVIFSIIGGMAVGVVLEIGLIMIINHYVNLPILILFQNIESYYQTLVFLMLVYGISVLVIMITNIRISILRMITDVRMAETNKGRKSLAIIGLLCFCMSLLGSYYFYEITGGNILLFGIVFSYLSLMLINYNSDFLIRKLRAKCLFLVSDYEYYYKTNKKLSLMLIALLGGFLFINTLASVMESSLKSNVKNYYPYDLVFTEEEADCVDINILREQYGVDVVYQSNVRFFYSSGYSILGVDEVNRETGETFQIPENHFLYVRSVVLDDGYTHEKGYVPDQIKINEESFDLENDIDRLLFCRGGGLTDNILLINQKDYERIVSELQIEKNLKLFRFGNSGYQDGLADYIEIQTGRHVASYYEAYKRATQSADLLYLLMGYISVVILASAIIAIHYKIESEKENDVYKYKLLIALGAEQSFIQKCIKEKLLVITILPLAVSIVWMGIVSYINTFSYAHQMIAVCRCIGIGSIVGGLFYIVCCIYSKNIERGLVLRGGEE